MRAVKKKLQADLALAFPARFRTGPDAYLLLLRERLLLDIQAARSGEPERFAEPMEEMSRALVALLAPQSLNPLDSQNVLLELERAYQNGVAELEQVGHRAEGLSVYEFVYKLGYLEKKRPAGQ